MDRNEIAGNWKQIKGRVKEKWGELTNDDIDRIEGRRERLVGVIQERYGRARDEASQEVDEFFDSVERAGTR